MIGSGEEAKPLSIFFLYFTMRLHVMQRTVLPGIYVRLSIRPTSVTLNGVSVIALVLRYFTEFDSKPITSQWMIDL